MEDDQQLLDLQWWQHSREMTIGARQLMKKAMKDFIDSGDETLNWMEYGLEKDIAGGELFRESLAKFLSRQYGDVVERESLAVTYGASHGLEMILTLVLRDGMPLFLQHPSYPPSINQGRDAKKEIIPLQCDEHGVIPEHFEHQLKQYFGEIDCHKQTNHHSTKSEDSVAPHGEDPLPPRGTCSYRGGAYLIPNFCNPTGCCLKEDRCRKIIALARKFNILLICDDVYNMMSFESDANGDFSPIHPRLFQFDKKTDPDYGKGHVVSIGTFSKIFFPAVRVGWLELPSSLLKHIKRLAFIFSVFGAAFFVSNSIKCLLDDYSLDDFLLKMRTFYKEQTKVFDESLRKYLPDGVTYHTPKGGFAFWIEMPHGIQAEDLIQLSVKKHKMIFLDGSSFSAVPGEYSNCVRLSVAICSNDKLDWVAKSISEDILELINAKR